MRFPGDREALLEFRDRMVRCVDAFHKQRAAEPAAPDMERVSHSRASTRPLVHPSAGSRASASGAGPDPALHRDSAGGAGGSCNSCSCSVEDDEGGDTTPSAPKDVELLFQGAGAPSHGTLVAKSGRSEPGMNFALASEWAPAGLSLFRISEELIRERHHHHHQQQQQQMRATADGCFSGPASASMNAAPRELFHRMASRYIGNSTPKELPKLQSADCQEAEEEEEEEDVGTACDGDQPADASSATTTAAASAGQSLPVGQQLPPEAAAAPACADTAASAGSAGSPEPVSPDSLDAPLESRGSACSGADGTCRLVQSQPHPGQAAAACKGTLSGTADGVEAAPQHDACSGDAMLSTCVSSGQDHPAAMELQVSLER